MKILTAYFSHSGENYFSGKILSVEKGNTAIVAEIISDVTGCDLFEIRRKKDYPYKYADCVKESREELAKDARPELAQTTAVSQYDVVILGYPNWCGTMPMPVFTFLESADFSGKTILPLCTNEGSGTGRSEADIRRLCPGARVCAGLSVKGGKAGESESLVREWLERNSVI